MQQKADSPERLGGGRRKSEAAEQSGDHGGKLDKVTLQISTAWETHVHLRAEALATPGFQRTALGPAVLSGRTIRKQNACWQVSLPFPA